MVRRGGNEVLIGGCALLAGTLTFGVAVGKSIGAGTSAIEDSQTASSMPVNSFVHGTVADLTQVEPTPALEATLSPTVLGLAVDRAPFQQDRQRPLMAYRLPGEIDLSPTPESPAPPPAPDFQLIGTVSGADGGWAIVRVEEGEPQMIALGEAIEGYTLNSVQGERAVMASADRSVSLSVPGPSPEVRTPPRVQVRLGNPTVVRAQVLREVNMTYTVRAADSIPVGAPGSGWTIRY